MAGGELIKTRRNPSVSTVSAAQGNADAQCNLGNRYKNGEGVDKDLKEAVRLYGLSAVQGIAQAQCNLGYCYETGQGVAKDWKEAVRLYGLSAAQGNAGAQTLLRSLEEVLPRPLERLSAAQGNAGAQSNLRSLESLEKSSCTVA